MNFISQPSRKDQMMAEYDDKIGLAWIVNNQFGGMVNGKTVEEATVEEIIDMILAAEDAGNEGVGEGDWF